MRALHLFASGLTALLLLVTAIVLIFDPPQFPPFLIGLWWICAGVNVLVLIFTILWRGKS